MKFTLPDIQIDFDHLNEQFRAHSKIILLSSLTVLVLTIISGLVIFFLSIKGSEQVMVPNVIGKELTIAMLEMQAKELYPKIQLKYSAEMNDKGYILEQNPSAGAIVKAGRRINLVISKGTIIDKIDNYVGQNIDDVKIHFQTLFTSMNTPLISIKEPPLSRYSIEPYGTILEQNPAPETPLNGPVMLDLVISRGSENNTVSVPIITGFTIKETLAQLSKIDIVFDFASRSPEGLEKAGTIVSQMPSEQTNVPAFSRVSAIIAMPVQSSDGKVYGIFSETLPNYPYPFQIKIETINLKGERSPYVSLKHPGGLLTFPYALEEGTVLVLTILNKETGKYEIRSGETPEAVLLQ